MIVFDTQYFQKFNFTLAQLRQYQKTALHDLAIAQEAKVPEVIFKFAYDPLIKYSIALIAKAGYKVRSAPGHHVKLIDQLAEILNNKDAATLGHKMRQTRNLDFYDGGLLITEKDARISNLCFIYS